MLKIAKFWIVSAWMNYVALTRCSLATSYRSDVGFGAEPDHFSGLSSSVRCSKSKLSLSKSEALYTWEVDGLLNYLRYLRDFGAKDFVHGTDNVVFDSEKINGEWSFEMRSTGKENFITATYIYTETVENENGNFGVKLKIFQPNFESIELPIQKPTTIAREKIHVETGGDKRQPQKNSDNNKSKPKPSTYLFLYESSEEEVTSEHKLVNTVSMKFNWPTIPTEKFLEFQNKHSELTFAFMIHAYFPKEAKHLKKSTCSLENLENKYTESSQNLLSKHTIGKNTFSQQNTMAMFASSKFSDCIISVDNIDIPVHGVILYYSSPILASLIMNATQFSESNSTANDKSSHVPVLKVASDIGYNGTIEMLRYIYTSQVDNLSNLAHKIILGAERYDLASLKQICEASLVTNVNLSNVINMYILGMDINSSRLIRKAFAVIQANRVHIVSQSEDFRKLSAKYPNLMFELFIS